MKKRWRLLLFIPLGLLILLLVLPFVVPADRWKNLAIDQLEKRTGWLVEAGSARLSIFPLGVRVAAIRVDDPDGDVGYERFAVRAEAVILRAELASVLRGAPNLQEIRLVRPQIELWAKSPAAPSTADADSVVDMAEPIPQPADQAPLPTLLAFVAIDDGQFTLHEVARKLVLRGIEQRIQLKLEPQGVQIELEGRLAGGELEDPSLPRSPLQLPKLELSCKARGVMGQDFVIEPLLLSTLGQTVQGRADWFAEGPRYAFELEWTGQLSELYTALSPQLPPLPPAMSSLQLEGGDLQMKLESLQPIDPAAPPALTLRAVEVQGRLGAFEALLVGEKIAATGAQWTLHEGELQVREVSLAMPGATCELELRGPLGATESLQLSGQLRGDLRALRAFAARLVPQLPAATTAELPPSSQWPGVAGMVTGNFTARLPQTPSPDPTALDAHATLQLRRVALLPPAWRDSLRVASGEVELTMQEAQLRDMVLAGPGFDGRGSGRVWGWPDRMETEWDLALGSVDLDLLQAALAPPEAEKAMGTTLWSRQAHAATPAAELPMPPANLGAEMRVTAQEMRSRGYRLTEVEARASLHERKLALRPTRAKLGSGELALDVDVDWTQTPPTWSGKSTAREVAAADLVRPFAAPLADALGTNFSGEIALNGPVSLERTTVLAALSGQATMQSAAGWLSTEPLLGETLRAFLGEGFEGFRKLDFRSLSSGVTVDGGQVRFDRFVLDGPTQLHATGQVGLDGVCDYALDVRLPAGLTPQLGDLAPLAELLRDADGRFSFRVAVQGPARKPNVSVDFDQLASLAAERAKSKASSELNRLLERGLESVSDSDTTASDPKAVLEGEGRKAVESLLDRFKKKKGKGAP